MTVDFSQILEEVKPMNVSRGKYIFHMKWTKYSFNSMCTMKHIVFQIKIILYFTLFKS